MVLGMDRIKKLVQVLITGIVLFVTNVITSQRVSTCEELGIKPTSGGGALGIYLQADSTGVGGKGCWVHHHPNGTDYVITPKNWGRNPNAYRARYIEDIMQAITDSKRVYRNYGKIDNKHFYILNNVYYGSTDRETTTLGEAVSYVNNECWLRSGVPSLRDLTRGQRKQVFAHEIGHCFNSENSPPLRAWLTIDGWLDESVAEYLSSIVYPRVNLEHRFAKDFDVDGQPFTQPYAAYPLWQYYADNQGLDKVVPLMTAIASKPNKSQRLSYLRSIGFDRIYHNFMFDFLRDKIRDPGGGIIPHESVRDSLRQEPFSLNPVDPQPLVLDTIPSERNSLFRIDLPAGYDITLSPPELLGEQVFYSLLDKGKHIGEWKEREKISGRCDEMNSIYIAATHLSDNAVTDISVNYELHERLGCCDTDVVINRNPSVERLEGEFTFDYHINSTLAYKVDGDVKSTPFDYYVNSKDGSILFSENFFFHDLDKEEFGGMEIKAVVWFPNAQLVAYVIDPLGIKRAITIDMNQTAADIMGAHTFGAKAFLRSAIGSRISPAPLPTESPWHGYATGYAYHLNDVEDPSKKGRVSGYISKELSTVKTALPLLGFMAGYIKDQENMPKTLVYSHFEDEEGNMLGEHLQQMDRQCYSFSGFGYKKMTLFGDTGAVGHMTEKEETLYDESQEKLIAELNSIVEGLAKCGGDERCAAELTKRMMDIQNKLAGNLYDLPSNPLYSGTSGSDFNAELKEIDKKMNVLLKQNIDKDVECREYEIAMRQCQKTGGSCGVLRTNFRNCKEEHDVLKEKLDKISCQKAKLMGTEGFMDGCD